MATFAEHEAYLALQHLAARQRDEAEVMLKEAGLGVTAYNVLRVLRGAGGAGLTCSEIGARLIHKDPDVTRLLDRLEKQGLVARARSAQDRRAVLVSLTEAGRSVLDGLEAPLAELHRRQFAHLSPERLRLLLDLLALPTPEATP